MRDVFGQSLDRRAAGRATAAIEAATSQSCADDQLPAPACAFELRAACLTLVSSPASLLTATSVVAPLAGRRGEVRTLRALGEELAELHGVEVACCDNGGSFTVRFSRRAPVPTSAPPRPGAAATLLARLGSTWKKRGR